MVEGIVLTCNYQLIFVIHNLKNPTLHKMWPSQYRVTITCQCTHYKQKSFVYMLCVKEVTIYQ